MGQAMSSEHISGPAGTAKTLLAYPFRIFFLSVAAWAIVSLMLWLAALVGRADWPFAMPALLWHQHEMLFGMLSAAIAGFLLTAVCVWTGTERLHAKTLLALWLVWLAGRISLAIGDDWPNAVPEAINLAFLPLVMLDAGRRILARRQWRHFPVMLALVLLWGMQWRLLIHQDSGAVGPAMVAVMLLMLVIGGRITPAFSASWLRARGRAELAADIAGPAVLNYTVPLIMLVLFIASWLTDGALLAGLAWLAGIITLLYILAWRGWRVAGEPLLWVLHLSLLWIPVSLGLLGLSTIGVLAAGVWLHAAGVGAMSGLILGVMSRVSLGHTGRQLLLPAGMTLAFCLLQASAVARVLTALSVVSWYPGILLSALCWMLAFALFLWRYTSILCSPRVDGRPG